MNGKGSKVGGGRMTSRLLQEQNDGGSSHEAGQPPELTCQVLKFLKTSAHFPVQSRCTKRGMVSGQRALHSVLVVWRRGLPLCRHGVEKKELELSQVCGGGL